MDIQSAFVSHVGRWRNENQDCFADIPHKNVFAVADGMGGLAEGSAASRLACKAFSYQADHDTFNLPAYFFQAHELVLQLAQRRGLRANQMGTTGVVALIDSQRNSYTVCWCGDSRLYHFKWATQSLEQITVDHSYVQQLLARGSITSEQALTHPDRNIITQAIGIGEVVKTNSKKRNLEENDVLILCTDGLNNEVHIEQMTDLCRSYCTDPQRLAEELVSHALENGGHDNVTVGVVRCFSTM